MLQVHPQPHIDNNKNAFSPQDTNPKTPLRSEEPNQAIIHGLPPYVLLNCTFLIIAIFRLQISSHTWTKESHGLFDYDLKDVLTVVHDAQDHTNIIRKELNVEFSNSKIDDLIAKISHSEGKHWWIYHQNKYSGSNS